MSRWRSAPSTTLANVGQILAEGISDQISDVTFIPSAPGASARSPLALEVYCLCTTGYMTIPPAVAGLSPKQLERG